LKTERIRVDQALVERGLAPSREKAQALLMAGEVFMSGQRIDKPGTRIPRTAELEVRGRGLPFASRGGLKLEKALEVFDIRPEGLVAADLGASTGGFTDCLLQRGARRVHAVDVGRGQLDLRLRQDPRVVVRERTNARFLKPEDLGETVDLVTLDLSFISLELVLPAVRNLVNPGGAVVALVKPQFEAGPARVGRGGVVRDPEVHRDVLLGLLRRVGALGFTLFGLTFSPVRGPAGNIEFLAGFRRNGGELLSDLEERVSRVVEEAWTAFESPS
jgi:23S rRNA (cytidine1920-2'-O)/16S rRNA (cytidine1409-2'-O)-methyltransferase